MRTWAPRGQTPVLRHPGGWKKLSAAAGVTRRGFYFRLYPGSIKARQLIHFLGHLKRQVRGKILLVWDRLGVHRSRAVREPRAVLAEFGLILPEGVEIAVHDSTAELRYLVLPERPAGTDDWSEERLAALVTRDCMIGTARPSLA